ncbi:MAG: YfhO family protein [Candidatus Curtissbacteria bacterium]|nr:YfhO family protein [Candidatus Curtissbacteria bacterium]
MKFAFLLFTFFTFLIFLPIFFGKVNLNGNLLVSFYPPYGQNLPYKNTGWDQLRIYFPFYKVTLDSIKNLDIPLWNPYTFSGHPHMADFQSAVFYPLNLFGIFLPQIEFWHLLRITPTILAAFFTYLFLRRRKLSNVSAIFGAITFGFSPFILAWGEEVVMSVHSIVWLPLILWATDNYIEGSKKKYLLVISLATAVSFLGGYMQTSIYMFIFLFAYLAILFKKSDLFRILRIIGAFILGTVLAAVQLLPSAELFFNAARSEVTLRETLFQFLLPWQALATYFAPDFFGHPATHNFFRGGSAQYYEGIIFIGVAALVFAVFAVKFSWGNKFIKFLAISSLISLLTTLDWFGAKLFISLPIPFLSSSIPNRILFIPTFCLAILAAYGQESWLSEKSRNLYKVLLAFWGIYGAIVVFLLVSKVLNLPYFQFAQFRAAENITVSFRNLAIPAFLFFVLGILTVVCDIRPKFKRTAAILILILAAAHIFLFSQKYFSFSERKYVFPNPPILEFIKAEQGIYRTWGLGDAYLETNLATEYGIYFPEGYDSLNNRSYGEFTYVMQGARLSDYVFRADAGLGRASSVELLESESRRKLIDLLGIKYLIVKKEDFDRAADRNFVKVFDDGKYGVFENRQVVPRIFLASNYEGPPDIIASSTESEKEKATREKERRKLIPQKLLSPDFDFRNVLILEKPSPVSPQFGEGSVDIIKYEPQEVVVRTKSDQPKLLFISDNYYPGWKAGVDGDETEILRADYTFRAIPLTPGTHEVRFWFDSRSYKTGLLVSLVTLGIILFLTSRKNPLVG